MNKYLRILLVVSVLAYPASIEADTAFVAPAPAPVVVKAATVRVVTAAATTAKTTPAADDDSKSAWITAYASVPEETSDHPFITASGNIVADGIVAANWLPFGTKIQIPALFGDKVFTVEDRMNQKFNSRVDIWMPSVDQAINFGLRKAKIVILDSAMAVK